MAGRKKTKAVAEEATSTFVFDRFRSFIGWLSSKGRNVGGGLMLPRREWQRLKQISAKNWEDLSPNEVEIIYNMEEGLGK